MSSFPAAPVRRPGVPHASLDRSLKSVLRILRRVVAEFGAETAPDQVDAGRFAEWFGSQWAGRAPLLATSAREDA